MSAQNASNIAMDKPLRFAQVPIYWSPIHFAPSDNVYDVYAQVVDEIAVTQGELVGFCNISGMATQFGVEHPNLRETVMTRETRAFNRQRQMVCALSIALFNTPVASVDDISEYVNHNNLILYTTEANGALFNRLRTLIRPELFFFSEYLGPQYAYGQSINGVRHEDIQHSSFSNDMFDLILSSEVFEHIPDAVRAEQEIVRILKPSGTYCFTVPLVSHEVEQDLVKAALHINGSILFFGEPEYHGDPVRPEEGILVYRVFSQQAMNRRFSALGCVFTTYHLWSRLLGILGGNAFIHLVRKG